ncbi:hypothetical protein K438DRAFT_1784702 [Mycena galopus ATCC 62051]|nr:hypothetical protein K438DRAFT_1784702 [Mycena galopus ATCC 62051]
MTLLVPPGLDWTLTALRRCPITSMAIQMPSSSYPALTLTRVWAERDALGFISQLPQLSDLEFVHSEAVAADHQTEAPTCPLRYLINLWADPTIVARPLAFEERVAPIHLLDLLSLDSWAFAAYFRVHLPQARRQDTRIRGAAHHLRSEGVPSLRGRHPAHGWTVRPGDDEQRAPVSRFTALFQRATRLSFSFRRDRGRAAVTRGKEAETKQAVMRLVTSVQAGNPLMKAIEVEDLDRKFRVGSGSTAQNADI